MLNIEEREHNPMKIIGLCKEKIKNILMLDDDIVQLVMPNLDDSNFSFEQNWFGCKITDNINGNKEARYLIGHCKDTPYFDETIKDQRVMICMESYINRFKPSYMDISVNINVVCHKDMMDIPESDLAYWKSKGYAGNRVDMICMAIYNALTQPEVVNNFGIGKMNLDYYSPQLQSFKPNFYEF